MTGKDTGETFSNEEMLAKNKLPENYHLNGDYDEALTAYLATTGEKEINNSQSWLKGTLEGIGNYAAGVSNIGSFVAWATILSTMNIIASVFSSLSGLVFDKSIDVSILHMGDFFASGGVVDLL